MKVTRKQFDKAVEDYPKLKKAHETITGWQTALKRITVPEGFAVAYVEWKDGQLTWGMMEVYGPHPLPEQKKKEEDKAEAA